LCAAAKRALQPITGHGQRGAGQSLHLTNHCRLTSHRLGEIEQRLAELEKAEIQLDGEF
jgi:hypothetical protein